MEILFEITGYEKEFESCGDAKVAKYFKTREMIKRLKNNKTFHDSGINDGTQVLTGKRFILIATETDI